MGMYTPSLNSKLFISESGDFMTMAAVCLPFIVYYIQTYVHIINTNIALCINIVFHYKLPSTVD